MARQNNPLSVGRAKGPGERTFEFQFITPDKDRVKIGEFVYYVYTDQLKKEHKVLCRVVNRNPLRLYPDVMLSQPVLNPADIACTIDYTDSEEMDFYLIDAQIIGFFDDKKKIFENPRVPPKPGVPILLADGDDLEKWINPIMLDKPRSACIGHLLSRKVNKVPISIDVNDIVSTHLAVLAATGSGKSYTVGVVLEEMMMAKNRGAVLVIDPHDEYNTLEEMENNSKFHDGSYRPEVNLLKSDDIHIKLSTMNALEVIGLLKNLSEKMQNYLRTAFNTVKKRHPASFTVQDIKDELDGYCVNNGQLQPTIDGIKWRLDAYLESKQIISDVKHIHLREILMPGKITVLNVSSLKEEDQQLTVTVLLDRILKQRILAERGDSVTNDPDDLDPNKNQDLLDYPVFIVLEEGHRFAPANSESRSKYVLKTILSEGRKFGVGVCLVSQRPGKLDSDVLSQCMTQIIMKIINPIDQKNIRDSVEAVSEDIIDELPGLTMGQAVIAGEAINTPVLINIRERITEHGGDSPEAVENWRKYKKEEKVLKAVDNQDEPLL
ncbi:MAG: DUF87 domain-containing protein [Candidatus Lokiarchaeota archaeon]|nr:DUF87 domain-containing protein [Candidatus Lokiarchaeota archaeon]